VDTTKHSNEKTEIASWRDLLNIENSSMFNNTYKLTNNLICPNQLNSKIISFFKGKINFNGYAIIGFKSTTSLMENIYGDIENVLILNPQINNTISESSVFAEISVISNFLCGNMNGKILGGGLKATYTSEKFIELKKDTTINGVYVGIFSVYGIFNQSAVDNSYSTISVNVKPQRFTMPVENPAKYIGKDKGSYSHDRPKDKNGNRQRFYKTIVASIDEEDPEFVVAGYKIRLATIGYHKDLSFYGLDYIGSGIDLGDVIIGNYIGNGDLQNNGNILSIVYENDGKPAPINIPAISIAGNSPSGMFDRRLQDSKPGYVTTGTVKQIDVILTFKDNSTKTKVVRYKDGIWNSPSFDSIKSIQKVWDRNYKCWAPGSDLNIFQEYHYRRQGNIQPINICYSIYNATKLVDNSGWIITDEIDKYPLDPL